MLTDYNKIEVKFKKIWQYAKKLEAFSHDDEKFLNAIMEIDKKILKNMINERYNRDLEKVRKLRFLILDAIVNEKPISTQRIEYWKTEIKNEYEKNVFRSWPHLFNILFELYYRKDKDEIMKNLEEIHDWFRKGLEIENLIYFNKQVSINGFDWNQNFGTSDCWMALIPEEKKNHKNAPQLYLHIYPNSIQYGLKLGIGIFYSSSNKRIEWKFEDDSNTIKTDEDFNIKRILRKFRRLLKKFYILDNIFNSYKIWDLNPQDNRIIQDEINNYIKGSIDSEELEFRLNDLLKNKVIMEKESEKIQERLSEPMDEECRTLWNVLKRKKQLILYGPPGTGKTYLANKMKKYFEESKFLTFHQSYAYEEFIEGIRPITDDNLSEISYEIISGVFKLAAEEATKMLLQMTNQESDFGRFLELPQEQRKNLIDSLKQEDQQKYLLIIDEINRGNISKIFGELITLLEADKRLGCENEIILELPYSKNKFGIPPNLYIIGTMNSADHSISLVDTALRRRFTFKELTPNTKHLEEADGIISEISLIDLFTVLNTKIEFFLDRDHRIGHSYFMNAKSLEEFQEIWFDEIIPLLQEYFYNDWETLSKILSSFVEEIRIPEDLLEEDLDRKIYRIKDENEVDTTSFIEYINEIIGQISTPVEKMED